MTLLAFSIGLLLITNGLRAGQPQPEGSGYCATEAEVEILQHINAFREDNGLEPLNLSRPLGAAAESKAEDMARNDYLAHIAPDGQGLEQLLNQAGYTYNTAIGENIAAGQRSAEGTFEQWVNSPEHREIMLGEDFTAIGIGRAHNREAKYDWYWAAEFGGMVGKPAQACDGATPVATPERTAGSGD